MFTDKASSLFLDLTTGRVVYHSPWNLRRFRVKYFLRTLVYPVTTFRYLSGICEQNEYKYLLTKRAYLPAKIHRPYLFKGLSVSGRGKAILSHYSFVQKLAEQGITSLFLRQEQQLLARFYGKDEACMELFCSPGYYDREGEITLSLHYNGNPVANMSLSFIEENNAMIACIGGLQGPNSEEGQQLIRQATRACYGVFPKKMLLDTLRVIAMQCGVSSLRAVGNKSHVFMKLRYFFSKKEHFVANYDEFWSSVGGTLGKHNLFSLPLTSARKNLEDVASKKRAEYRKRYALLDDVENQIMCTLGAENPVAESL